MRIEVIFCPSCNHKLRVPEDLMGTPVQCPQCAATFVAPPPATEGEAPPLQPPMPPSAASATDPWQPRAPSIPATGPQLKRVAPGLALAGIALVQLLYFALDLWAVTTKPEVARQAFADSQQAAANMGLPVQPAPFDPAKFAVVFYACFIFVSAAQGLGGLALARGKFLWLAFIGATIALVNCIAIPCCLLSVPVGLWCMVVLMQADVRASFQ